MSCGVRLLGKFQSSLLVNTYAPYVHFVKGTGSIHFEEVSNMAKELCCGNDHVGMAVHAPAHDTIKWLPRWTIEKYDEQDRLIETRVIEGNILLDDGITRLLNL